MASQNLYPLSSWSAAKILIPENLPTVRSFASLQHDNSKDFSESSSSELLTLQFFATYAASYRVWVEPRITRISRIKKILFSNPCHPRYPWLNLFNASFKSNLQPTSAPPCLRASVVASLLPIRVHLCPSVANSVFSRWT